MKKIRFLLLGLFLIFASVSLASCKKDDSDYKEVQTIQVKNTSLTKVYDFNWYKNTGSEGVTVQKYYYSAKKNAIKSVHSYTENGKNKPYITKTYYYISEDCIVIVTYK